MYLIKFTGLQRRPEAVDTASVHITLVLVTITTDLVEITQGEPSCPRGRLLSN
jgi:hypothetical protein